VTTVIPAPQSRERDLALETEDLKDSASPRSCGTPRNDRPDGFFSILLRSIAQLLLSLQPQPDSNGKGLPGSTLKSINPREHFYF
jgi:hypothetical protein